MNSHQTCATCLHNVDARCTNEASRYHGAPLRSWNTCSAHQAPAPAHAELLARLAACADGLDHIAAKVATEYRDWYAYRAAQCRSWADGVRAGDRNAIEDIAGGLQEFEAMAS